MKSVLLSFLSSSTSLKFPRVPFKRLTYDQVLADLKAQGVSIPWGEDIPTEAFRELGKLYPFFYFITEWPTHAKAFYIKPREDKPEVCEGFDLMWRYIELVSGGTRIIAERTADATHAGEGFEPRIFQVSSAGVRLWYAAARWLGHRARTANDDYDGQKEHPRSHTVPAGQSQVNPVRAT